MRCRLRTRPSFFSVSLRAASGVGAGGRTSRNPSIVLRPGRAEAITEAGQLLGIYGVDLDPTVRESLDHRTMERLDGDRNLVSLMGLSAKPVYHPPPKSSCIV